MEETHFYSEQQVVQNIVYSTNLPPRKDQQHISQPSLHNIDGLYSTRYAVPGVSKMTPVVAIGLSVKMAVRKTSIFG